MNIEAVTLGEITALISVLAILGGVILYLSKLWSRFERLERQGIYRQEDTAMMFECLRACMEGLIQNGSNGPVKDTLKKLNDYTCNKAAGLSGRGGKQ